MAVVFRWREGYVHQPGLGGSKLWRRRSVVVCNAPRSKLVPANLVAFGKPDEEEGSAEWALLGTERSRDRVIPIPLVTRIEVDLVRSSLIKDKAVSAFDVGKVLFQTQDICSTLWWKEVGKAEAVAGLYARAVQGKFGCSLDVLEEFLSEAPSKVVRLSLQEVEGLAVNPIIGGKICFKREIANLFGQRIYSQDVIIEKCRPGEVISLSKRFELPIMLEDWMIDLYSVPLRSDKKTGSLRLSSEVEVGDEGTPKVDAEIDVGSLTKKQVLSMERDSLRSALRAVSIPSLTRSPNEQLLDLLLPWLDETVRREILIDRAVKREDYLEAARLQEGQSERSILKRALDEAVEEERYGDAQKIKDRLDRLTEMRADPTQDEGSYDPYLDQDEWYKPVR